MGQESRENNLLAESAMILVTRSSVTVQKLEKVVLRRIRLMCFGV